MRKVWAVVRREFVERVRTRWFIFSTVLGPVFMAAVLVLPLLFAERGAERRDVTVVDATSDGFGERLVATLNQLGTVRTTRLEVRWDDVARVADSLARRVGLQVLDGFLIVTDAAVDSGRAEYRGANVTSPSDMRALQVALRSAVVTERLRREGVEPAVVARAQAPVALVTTSVRDGQVTGASGESTFLLAYAMWFLLYIAILLYGVQVMGSVIEEKTTRMVEVLVSSLKPFHLLAGKIVGVGAVGLLQLGIWLGFGKLLLERRVEVARMLGQGPETATALAGLSLPDVPLATIGVFLSYFLLGYFLYAAMFAAVAAMVNSESEARQAQLPVVMLLVVPTLLMVGILNNPDGSLAVTLSLIPFMSPIAMPVRWAAAPVPATELAASLVILLATVVAIMWLAGRIYRVGILMHGKKPGLRELARWVRG
jgi:ABC-2 type transport system permease protein